MTKPSAHEELDRSLEHLRFDGALKERVRERAQAPARRGVRRLSRRAVAALAVCAALIISALAAGSALWEQIQNDLGVKAPFATAVPASAEDQGLRLEVQTALFDNKTAKLYFTMTDLEGDRLDGNTVVVDFDLDNPQEEGNEEMPWNSASVEQLSYDAQTRTAAYVLTIKGWSTQNRQPIRMTVVELSPGRRAAGDWVDLKDSTADPVPSELTPDGQIVLTPDPARVAAWEAQAPEEREPYAIMAAGFAADGRLHLRVRTPEVPPVWSEVEALVFVQEEGQGGYVGRWEDVTAVAVEGGVDYRFDDYTPEDLPRMRIVEVDGSYSFKSAPIQGAWAVEVPFRGIESREIPIYGDVRVPTICPEDTLRADKLVLSPLSLTLYCSDYYNGHMLKCPVAYEELGLAVTFADGTVAAPTAASSNTGWAVWEFDAPIDPDQAVSVTLAGQEIKIS